MNRKSKVGRIKGLFRGPVVEGFGVWFRIIMTTALAIVASHVIAFSFNLSTGMRFVIMVLFCVVVMVILGIRPRLLLMVVCVTLLFMGVLFTVGSMSRDNMGETVWDSGLLGVGVSLVALAVTIYVLQDQVGRKRDAVNISGSERDVHNSEDGYVWLEESRKYRCEYCKRLGKRHCCKTLGGIERHIASKHV
jgi:hypothetical protein